MDKKCNVTNINTLKTNFLNFLLKITACLNQTFDDTSFNKCQRKLTSLMSTELSQLWLFSINTSGHPDYSSLMRNWVSFKPLVTRHPPSPPFPQKFPFPPIEIAECPSLTSLPFDLTLNRVFTKWKRIRPKRLPKM